MKKIVIFLLIFAVGMFPALIATGGIENSSHDFSDDWSGGKICIVCHTPHDAANVPSAPLWNHELSVGPWTPYSSTTMDATVGDPDGVSKLCLSCHDGTVALDSFGDQSPVPRYIDEYYQVGPDLRYDHPVSFTYDAALADLDGDLYDPITEESGLGGTIDEDMLLDNKLECSSCHDVHNGSGLAKLLVKSNANSALCLTCHDK